MTVSNDTTAPTVVADRARRRRHGAGTVGGPRTPRTTSASSACSSSSTEATSAPRTRRAPYSVELEPATVTNGSHTLTAVARDAAGNTATSQRTVTVSNDATDPTVGLTTPAAGATVSGSVTIAANASDNVGVVGVQFKIDGANLGAEDTSAPYSVELDVRNVPNGAQRHGVRTRCGRQHADLAAHGDRVELVGIPHGPEAQLGTAGAVQPGHHQCHECQQAALSRQDEGLRPQHHRKLVGQPGLWIEGGRNVRVVGGHIEMNTAGDSAYWDRTGVKVRYSTGVVHLEGLLIDGAYLADGS